jgi:hypothetical protein
VVVVAAREDRFVDCPFATAGGCSIQSSQCERGPLEAQEVVEVFFRLSDWVELMWPGRGTSKGGREGDGTIVSWRGHVGYKYKSIGDGIFEMFYLGTLLLNNNNFNVRAHRVQES